MPESLEDTLEKASGEPLLAVTPNPVKKNVVNLGLSELWALVASTVGTTAVSFATTSPTVLAVSGPVCEKPMFLARHLLKAVREFRQSKEKEFWKDYFKPEMKDAARELWMDVAFHDSVYVGLAHALLSHSSLHPGIAATFAFAAAVPAAALLRVGLENTAHRVLVALSGAQGVSWEKYMEARFLYQGDAQALQENVRTRYALGTQISGKYSDEYLAHRLLGLAERAVVARKRVVTDAMAYLHGCHKVVQTTRPKSQMADVLVNI
ncbi:hypothetical protein HY490_02395 [Candidatus Woesearchaeota archaeon]|nr:hypothetical protein [Candidatus Woesearchaeota archaeon]